MIGFGFGLRKYPLTYAPPSNSVPAQGSAAQAVGLSIAATATNTRVYAQGSASQVIDVSVEARLAGTVGLLDPLTIVTSVPKALYFHAEVGVTQSGGVVSAWNDQTGNARHATASGSAQPAFAAASIGGRAALVGDGVDDFMTVAWNPPAPGTTNLWFFLILRQITWTAGDYIFGSGNLALALVQSATTPQIRQFNAAGGANANGNLAVGTAGGVEAFYSNSTADYIRAGSAAAVTGANAGNTDATTFAIFGRPTGIAPANVAISALFATEGKPTSGEIAALRTWAAAYHTGITI